MKTLRKLIPLFLTLTLAQGWAQETTKDHVAWRNGKLITILNPTDAPYYPPLAEIQLDIKGKGQLVVYDGNSQPYVDMPVNQSKISFKTGGALGGQMICLKDNKGKIIDHAFIRLNCQTMVKDEKGEFEGYLNMLYNSMMLDNGGGGQHLYNGKVYKTWDGWFQDNVHTFKGMKYWDPQVKDFVDLFAEGQKENGMIYDNYYHPYDDFQSWYDRFGPEFVVQGERTKNSSFFCRIPIENEPEFSFLEAVYYVWKATGDDAWMKKRLNNCIKAIQYTRTDPYRWSEKFQLTKRAYTIDIWDFQCNEDAALYRLNDIMKAELGKTRYGISYADNIGMAIGCEYVSEMLDYLGQKEEAQKYRQMAIEWRKRTDEVCWNGHFYRHWVPEDPSIKRDFGGTDESKQVSLSNTYCLNRRMPHDKAVEIIRTYRKIRQEMPSSSPGEWYLLYPPYEKGWHLEKWEYMNGGVSPITAGELAHGAYGHGFESYATDILRRVCALAEKSGGRLYDTYKGALPEKPIRNFTPVSLKSIANADFKGDENTPGVNAWTNENPPVNDMINFPVGKQIFHDIPFNIIDPATNGRKACVILSSAKGYPSSATINLNAKAASLYFVHAKTGSDFAAYLKINYADGTSHKKNMIEGRDVAGWWYPKDAHNFKVAWKGPNRFCQSVGMYVWGYNNPYPDKVIKSIELVNDNENSKWMIAALTLSDYRVWFDPGILSYGIPSNWADAAVIYAMIEGLVGVKDAGVAFNKLELSPRWITADIHRAEACIRYAGSNGYAAYQYFFDGGQRQLSLTFTTNAAETKVRLLLPENPVVKSFTCNGKTVAYTTEKIEASTYAVFTTGRGINEIKLSLQ